MKTLEIIIPDEIFNSVQFFAKQDENFILKAIREKIEKEKKNDLTTELIQGYQATAEDDLALTKEFEHADFENL